MIVAGLFERTHDAHEAIADLERNGINRNRVTLIAHPDRSEPGAARKILTSLYLATGARILAGGAFGGLLAVSAGTIVLIAGVGFVFGTALTLLMLMIAGIVVGGIAGALTTVGMTGEEAQLYAEGVRRGLTLVAVDTKGDKVRLTGRILRAHRAIDLERTDDIRVAAWQSQAPPRVPADVAALTARPGVHSRVYDFYAAMAGRGGAGTGASRPGPPPLDQSVPPAQSAGELGAHTYPNSPFRAHYDQYYAGIGGVYEDYLPAYRYGYGLGRETAGVGPGWDEIEREMHSGWERIQPGTWERHKEAIRHGWNVARVERRPK